MSANYAAAFGNFDPGGMAGLVERPMTGTAPDHVVVRIAAATVNPTDVPILTGDHADSFAQYGGLTAAHQQPCHRYQPLRLADADVPRWRLCLHRSSPHAYQCKAAATARNRANFAGVDMFFTAAGARIQSADRIGDLLQRSEAIRLS
jgi:hypothetical protein